MLYLSLKIREIQLNQQQQINSSLYFLKNNIYLLLII